MKFGNTHVKSNLTVKTLATVFLASAILPMHLANAASAPAAAAGPKKEIPVVTLHTLKEAANIEFHAVGRPSLLRVNGKGDGPEGGLTVQDGKAKGTLTVDLSKLDSGIETRDKHMKEKYLETEKFPKAQLTLNDLALPPSWSVAKPDVKDAPFTGTLKLHGVEKPVTGTFTSKSDNGKIAIEAKFDLKLSDFAIAIPSYAGITIADQVNVAVNVKTDEDKGGTTSATTHQ